MEKQNHPDIKEQKSHEEVDTQNISRKSFLKRAVAAAGALLVAVPVLPGIMYAVEPVGKKFEREWVSLGKLDEFKEEEPKLTTFPLSLDKDTTIPRAVYVLKKSSSDFVIFDSHCTHLGCPVTWNENAQYFLCPCHGAVFEKDGSVLTGPPPRPLNRYNWKVQNNELYINNII